MPRIVEEELPILRAILNISKTTSFLFHKLIECWVDFLFSGIEQKLYLEMKLFF